MKHIGFLNQRRIPVLLLVFLITSIVLNIYLYYYQDMRNLPQMPGEYVISMYHGMGNLRVILSEGFAVRPKCKFNVTVAASLWAPYTSAATYSFYFKLYERSLHGEYSSPILEKWVNVSKNKDEMWIELCSGNLTVTASGTEGIYVYKVYIACIETLPGYSNLHSVTRLPIWEREVEFPIITYYPYQPTF